MNTTVLLLLFTILLSLIYSTAMESADDTFYTFEKTLQSAGERWDTREKYERAKNPFMAITVGYNLYQIHHTLPTPQTKVTVLKQISLAMLLDKIQSLPRDSLFSLSYYNGYSGATGFGTMHISINFPKNDRHLFTSTLPNVLKHPMITIRVNRMGLPGAEAATGGLQSGVAADILAIMCLELVDAIFAMPTTFEYTAEDMSARCAKKFVSEGLGVTKCMHVYAENAVSYAEAMWEKITAMDKNHLFLNGGSIM